MDKIDPTHVVRRGLYQDSYAASGRDGQTIFEDSVVIAVNSAWPAPDEIRELWATTQLTTIRKGPAMTSIINHLEVSRFLQLYDDVATQKGIKLSMGFDFNEYISITRATPAKQPTSRTFQPPIKSGDGFWMIGVDKNNDVAVLQAVRLYDVSRINFAELLEKVFCDDPTLYGHPHDSWTCIAPSAKKMIGKVAYHGDGWVRRDYRGRGMPKIMAGVAFGLSFSMWDPDFVCALVAPWLLDKGVVAQYGYAHHEAGGLRLIEQNVLKEYLLIWLTGQELRNLVNRRDKSELISVA